VVADLSVVSEKKPMLNRSYSAGFHLVQKTTKKTVDQLKKQLINILPVLLYHIAL